MTMPFLLNPANLITGLRIGLAAAVIGLLQVEIAGVRLLSLALVALIFFLDWLDGAVARGMDVETKLGGSFDIIADRIIENAFWIFFAFSRQIPLWIPIVILLRGFLTWAAQRAAAAMGRTEEGEFALMHSGPARALVASRASRGAYGVLKAVSFGGLAFDGFTGLAEAQGSALACLAPFANLIGWITMPAVYLTVALCLVRGALIMRDALSRKLTD